MRLISGLLLALHLAAATSAAEVVVRQQATPSGSVVRLGDVADLSAADPGVVEELAAAPLLPTPPVGASLHLNASQIRDLLSASGVDVKTLEFHGAETVTLYRAPDDASASDASRTAPVRPSREAAGEALAAEISNYLQMRTGHELWSVQVDAEPALAELYWHAGADLAVAGGKEPYTGRQVFTLSDAAGTRVVRAFARVQRLEMAVFAVRAIAAGDFVRAADVTVRPYAGVVSSQIVRSVDAVVGKEAVQNIRAGAMLSESQVRAPLLVRRGETVTIRARASGVVVRTYGVAQQNGARGDLVQVQSLDGKERYAARVSGVRELELFAAGASAADVVQTLR